MKTSDIPNHLPYFQSCSLFACEDEGEKTQYAFQTRPSTEEEKIHRFEELRDHRIMLHPKSCVDDTCGAQTSPYEPPNTLQNALLPAVLE